MKMFVESFASEWIDKNDGRQTVNKRGPKLFDAISLWVPYTGG